MARPVISEDRPAGRLRPRRPAPLRIRVGDARLPAVVWVLAGVQLVATLFYSFVQPQTPVRLVRGSAALIEQSAFWSAVTRLPWPVPRGGLSLALALLVMGVVAFAGYGAAVAVCWNRPATRRALLAVALSGMAFMTLSALALPTQSSDIYDYILKGRMATVYGVNPYQVAPDEFPDDPLYPYASGQFTVHPEKKPPTWIYVTIAWSALAGDDPVTNLLVYRFGFLALNLLNVALIIAFLRRWRPEALLAGVALYAWNPIVILHGQAKTDTLMTSFVLLAAVLLFAGRRHGSAAALGLSMFVKLLTLPLLAVTFFGELGARRWRSVVLSGLAVALAVTVIYIPVASGPGLILQHLGELRRGGSDLPRAFSLPVMLGAAGLVAWAGVASRGKPERVLGAWALVAVCFAVFFNPLAFSWYLLVPLALVSLTAEWRLTVVTGVLSFLAFLANSWDTSTSPRFPLPKPDGLNRPVAFLAVIALTAAAAGAVLWFSSRRRNRTSPRETPSELETESEAAR
ncbi:MAG: hypothetical protein H0V05_20670 [Euzebyaceae bacterium]|nr:hypothetical protein [Euzebyaceae bacterium]